MVVRGGRVCEGRGRWVRMQVGMGRQIVTTVRVSCAYVVGPGQAGGADVGGSQDGWQGGADDSTVGDGYSDTDSVEAQTSGAVHPATGAYQSFGEDGDATNPNSGV